MHNSRSKKLHRTSPGFNFNFLEGGFTNRDNIRTPIQLIQFKTERQSQDLKYDLSSKIASTFKFLAIALFDLNATR